jgi:hypothetical protein
MSLIISTIYGETHAMLVNENKDKLKIEIGFYSYNKPIKTDFKMLFLTSMMKIRNLANRQFYITSIYIYSCKFYSINWRSNVSNQVCKCCFNIIFLWLSMDFFFPLLLCKWCALRYSCKILPKPQSRCVIFSIPLV